MGNSKWLTASQYLQSSNACRRVIIQNFVFKLFLIGTFPVANANIIIIFYAGNSSNSKYNYFLDVAKRGHRLVCVPDGD